MSWNKTRRVYDMPVPDDLQEQHVTSSDHIYECPNCGESVVAELTFTIQTASVTVNVEQSDLDLDRIYTPNATATVKGCYIKGHLCGEIWTADRNIAPVATEGESRPPQDR